MVDRFPVSFEGKSVGLMEVDGAPLVSGSRAYLPLRSLSHLEMVTAVHTGRRPRCTCRIGEGTVSFIVSAIPEAGRLVIEDVVETASAPAPALPADGPPAATDGAPPPYRPQRRRVVLAFLLAPLAASAAPGVTFALADFASDPARYFAGPHESVVDDTLFFAFVAGYPLTLVFGLPLFALLYGRVGFGPLAPTGVGFVIVMAGILILEASDHPVDREGLLVAAGTGVLGAFGGFVFWLIAVWRDPARRARAP